ncbi:hypothetical protein TVAG_456760 [Trichomonas vaginalis G3]|uniref:Uncharacterized protein n=1 Tax=Trichomonas vaginalis (strain ATCC PRA-98 / G3) TaxID=412133 RepID=A2DC00_TRIV3|nr:adenylate cyclase protein [Trichomonas vaginalis G3]EAY22041.1 hypothetical protein TVAG_456760 [Trichomonas vaginalis G3]KAI5525334.1 adenylate cyclase protein [Trichomonas vaginalis G3]|eukprot:XP_001583027.1 hypothetical protein [Trichomonas vaginalis G3]
MELKTIATFQSEIMYALNGSLNMTMLILSIISMVLITITYLIHKIVTSHPIFIQSTFLSGWNLSPLMYVSQFFTILFIARISIHFYENYAKYCLLGATVLVAVTQVIVTTKFPYYRKSDQFIMIFFWVLAALDTIACILYLIWHDIFYPESTFIIAVLIILAFIITNFIIDRFYALKLSEKPLSDEKSSSTQEVDNFENFDVEEGENEDLLIERKALKDMTKKFYSYIYIHPHEAIKLAKFISKNTDNNNLKVDCYKYLCLMHQIEAEDITEIRSMRKNSGNLMRRQLLCDLQYEAFSLNPDESVVDSYMKHLMKITNKCRRIYFEIVDMIAMAQPDDIESCLFRYHDCIHNFEKYAKVYTINCPSSQRLTNFISCFYSELKADANLSMAWRHISSEKDNSAGISENSGSEFITFQNSKARFSRKSQGYSSHNYEVQTTQNLSSQMHISSIYSCGCRSFSILSFLLFFFVFYVAIARVNPSNYLTVVNLLADNLINSIDVLQSKPINSIINISANSISNCNPSYKNLTSITNNLSVLLNYHDYISMFSDAVYYYNVQTSKPEDVLLTWSSINKYIKNNLTYHTSEAVLAILLESMSNFSCSKETAIEVTMASDLFNSSIFTNSLFFKEIYDNCFRFLTEFKNTYLAFIISFIVTLAVIMIGSTFMMIRRRKKERSYFWNSLIEIDPNSLEDVRRRLLSGTSLIKDTRIESSSNDVENILGSDKLDATNSGSGTTENSVSSQRDLCTC